MNRHSRIWSLQEAKAKFSEVVRLAQTEGPQLVTVHGKEAVTIVAAGSAAAGRDEDTGAGLIRILENSPLRELGKNAFRRPRTRVTNRRIDL
jgi:prevent-host-death family protein